MPMNSDFQRNMIEMRRAKVLKLAARGLTQAKIADELGVSASLIQQDLKALKDLAKVQIQTYVDETLPEQHALARAGIDEIIKEAWLVVDDAEEQGTKIQALKLAMDAYGVKLAFLSDVQILDKTVKNVSAMRKTIDEIKKGGTAKVSAPIV